MTSTRNYKRICNLRITQHKRGYAGFTLFELVIGITIVGMLGAVLSERMLRYQEYAEKTAMEVTARQIQTGLRMQVADLMMRDRLHEADRLLQSNPMTWLETPPPNYVGERSTRNVSDELRGNWYFDVNRRELVYTPFHRRFFEPRTSDKLRVRYGISSVPISGSGSGREVEGLSLVLLTPYRWQVRLDWE
jgi:type II secretory pathway pseudopilin PulG